MEDIALRASKNVDRAEDDLTLALSRPETKHENLEPLLAKFRAACQDYIFSDFEAAAKKQVEARLWAAHSKVNSRFRPLLARFREGDGQKLKVERRKAEKVYLLFIKSSQAFYRNYIQRLASNFEGIPEILSLAHGMELDSMNQFAYVAGLSLIVDSAFSRHATDRERRAQGQTGRFVLFSPGAVRRPFQIPRIRAENTFAQLGSRRRVL
jgi:hypothetical protein